MDCKYFDNKQNLKDKIRQGNAKFQVGEAIEHACYFCRRAIKGNMITLIEKELIKGFESENKYFLDKNCFEQARAYH